MCWLKTTEERTNECTTLVTYTHGALEFEGRPLQEGGAVVVAARDQTIRPRLFDVDGVDDLAVTHDLSDR